MDMVFKFSRTPIAILSITLLIVISTLFATGLDEITSLHEMQHIAHADLQFATPAIQTEVEHHLQAKMVSSEHMLMMIGASLIVLIAGWIMTQKNIGQLRKIAATQKHLEELLYLNQVKAIHDNLPLMLTLPDEFVRLQQHRRLFNQELAQALTNRDFILYFQPIMDANTEQIVEVEALLRWQHPRFGLLSPDSFISLCENTGFIVPLGDWILRAACQQLKKWHAEGYAQLSIAINLSPAQLHATPLVETLRAIIQELSLSPTAIKLEITESLVMQDIPTTTILLKALKQLGVKLSLDDFGTKYSSLTYLKEFPFDIIKIDKSFVRDMLADETSFAIVESIAGLAKNLGLTLIAEGIDHPHQAQALQKLGCDRLQGYLYSKPLSSADCMALFSK